MLLSVIKFCDFKRKNSNNEVHNIPIDEIRPNPYQTRRYFDMVSLIELSESIKKFGVLQPIGVRVINKSFYELVYGERRLRASKMAGLQSIPCIIHSLTDKDSALMVMIENTKRQNLNFFEEAEGYESLLRYYKFSEEELATMLNKTGSSISNKIRLLKLDLETRQMIIENNLTERHAKAILKIPDTEAQKRVLKVIIDNDISPKIAENLVSKELEMIRRNKRVTVKNQVLKGKVTDTRLLRNTIKRSVDIIRKTGLDVNFEDMYKDNIYQASIKIKV